MMEPDFTKESAIEQSVDASSATVDVETGGPGEKSSAHKPLDSENVSAADEENGKNYPSWQQVVPVMVAMYLALFLVSLDRTIISTAIPQITDTFHSLGDIGWYGSAYMITGCAFQLFFGRVYTFYSPKWIFLGSIFLFELGSLICGVAQNSPTLIVGRAVAGLGSAGIMAGVIILMVHLIPLRKRPLYQGFMGAVFLVSSLIGPILGGAFTTKLSWRWCFFINLPVGGATMLTIFFFLKLPDTKSGEKSAGLSKQQKIDRLDPIGTLCLLLAAVCLLIALQWGGSTYAWSSARIIILLVLSGLLTMAFSVVQIWKQENATVPPRILKYRSVSASSFFAFCLSGSVTIVTFFLPSWFQAIQDVDAVESGIRIIPLILALVLASIMAGGLVNKIGYFTPMLIACSILTSVGAGLLTIFKVTTGEGAWIGYQILYGFGVGLGQQQSSLAAQTILPSADVPTGVSLKFFGQLLGGAIFVSVGQTVFSNKLVSGLSSLAGLDPALIVKLGATEIRGHVEPEMLGVVLIAYNAAFSTVFKVALALACLSIAGALLTEWKSVKGKNHKGV